MIQSRILVVDDVVENIQVVMNILREDSYDFSFAKSGKEALELLKKDRFDLVLLDIMMPGIDGYDVCAQMKKDPILTETPVIFLTAKTDIDSVAKAFKVGGVDYLTKPFHAEELLARVKTHIELHKAKQILKQNNLTLQTKMNMEITRILTELEDSQKEMIFILTELIESVSDETGRHIRRVAEYSKLLAHYHESLSDDDAEVLYHASPMHDIGKTAIPNSIIHKKGSLTEEEFQIMKTHPIKAHEYLKHSNRKIMKAADIIAHQHHEKWNGEGYPQGLKREEIHIYGRIVALADVFDALMHKRVYKDAWSIDETIAYIIEHSGTQFDPYIVKIFEEHIDEFVAISKI
ncbi:MAG: response regulator [Sulfurimonas sp.]|nr:response regulator [Sulfurimonas sp.]MBU1216124.1 response regulator [bacterium]MBU1434430.1 response regulator [bacterium]MBU1502008.1 response regulator [bacterium]MBU3939657.1 response regulator [bacterium]